MVNLLNFLIINHHGDKIYRQTDFCQCSIIFFKKKHTEQQVNTEKQIRNPQKTANQAAKKKPDLHSPRRRRFQASNTISLQMRSAQKTPLITVNYRSFPGNAQAVFFG